MNKSLILKNTREFVKDALEGEGTGHDYAHIERVVKLAKYISAREKKGDLFIIELSALLHDIADWKFNDGDDSLGPKIARDFLQKHDVDEKIIIEIAYIIQYISFKGGTNKEKLHSIEGRIVQDADRLDALGAIGIGRAFAYGGFKGREMYNPKVKPKKYKNLKQYFSSKNTTINHFYEKLLILPGLMNTETGKKIAKERIRIMKSFLKNFLAEWEVKL